MSRTNWLSRLINRSRSQKSVRPRRRVPLGTLRDWLLEDRVLPSAGSGLPPATPTTSTIFVGNNSYQVITIDDPTLVLFLGGTAKGVNWGTVPEKLLTFTNNAANKQTIYPFLYSPNDTAIYDPIDANNEEYREYVGYTSGGNTYLGVPNGASITISVPLVFWNGARADIAVTGNDLIPQPDQVNTLNPFQFYYSKNGVNASINIGTQGVVSSTGNNGIVMYYHSHDNGQPNNPSSAALGQLTEWTIRDKNFLTMVNAYDLQHSLGSIPSSELTTLINYDVSYVDDLLAPVAMEATQVPVPVQYIESGTVTSSVPNGSQTTTTIQLLNDDTRAFLLTLLNTKPDGALTMPSWDVLYDASKTQRIDIGTVTAADTSTGVVTVVSNGTVTTPTGQTPFVFSTSDIKQDFGWTGAQNSITDLQNTLTNFTSNNTAANPNLNGLGQYFGGLGWPTFYDPTNTLAKIPGGANIFANSPLTNQRSPYNQLFYLLSSGGAFRIQYGANGVLNPASQTPTSGSSVTFKINLSPDFTLKDLTAMQQALVNPLQPVAWKVSFDNKLIGTITAIDTATQIITVKLSQTIDNLPNGYSLDFQAPVSDPFATTIRDLWYSWANYYVNLAKFQNFTPQDIFATVSADTDSLANAKDTRILTFSGAQPQLALGMTVSGQGISGLITIEKISDDMKTVYLSAPVPQGLNGQTVKFTFSKPAAISTYGDPVLVNLFNFGNDKAFADLFAASVYETMAVYSTIAQQTIPQLPKSMSLIYECIGGGVGHLPTAAFVNISADVRDLGKSVLRGVPNFTNYPNTYTTDAQWKVGNWYPPPSDKTGGANFNVFNLDPYVWFVHQKLGLSGYGFSFDDDASDIGAGGTSSLSINYAGLNGFVNQSEWFASTPWGVVQSKNATISQYSGMDPNLQGSFVVALEQSWQGIIAFNKIRPDDIKNSLLGAYLNGKGIINNSATNSYTRVAQLVNLNALTFVMSQGPSVVNLPYTADLTFTGNPPQGVNAVLNERLLAAGTGAGQQPLLHVYDATSGQQAASFDVFDPNFLGGVRVAVGDVNGDGIPDVIIGAGPGGGPEVRIIDGSKLTMVDANGEIDDAAVLASFYAYDPRFPGGVFVAFGVSAGGRPEIITGADAGGGPHVKVIDATKLNQLLPNSQIADSALIGQFYAYDPSFTGGVRVAAADLNGDGVLDIVTGAGPGGGPHVKVIDGTKLSNLQHNSEIANSALIGQFYAYTPTQAPSGGVYVAASNQGGHPIIITGDGPQLAGSPSDGPLVKVIDATKLSMLDSNSEPIGAALLADLLANDPAFAGGVSVGALDVNGDGAVEIITGEGPGNGPAVEVIDGTKLSDLQSNQEIASSALLDNFYAFPSGFAGGVFVGAGA